MSSLNVDFDKQSLSPFILRGDFFYEEKRTKFQNNSICFNFHRNPQCYVEIYSVLVNVGLMNLFYD